MITEETNAPSLLDRLDACPPFLCYYGAHMGRAKRPTTRELIAASGMSPRTFMRISQQITWGGVTVKHAAQFAKACGIDLFQSQSLRDFIAQEVKNGRLITEFNGCGGAGERMMSQFNFLASKAVLAREKTSVTASA